MKMKIDVLKKSCYSIQQTAKAKLPYYKSSELVVNKVTISKTSTVDLFYNAEASELIWQTISSQMHYATGK